MKIFALYLKFIILLLIAFPTQAQNSLVVGKQILLQKLLYSPKMIIQQGKIWSYNQQGTQRAEIKECFVSIQDTFIARYEGILLGTRYHPFSNTTISWDIDKVNVYGLEGLRIGFDNAVCYGAGGSVMKIPQHELVIWKKGAQRDSNFNYWQASKNAFFGNLPLYSWFEKKYHQTFLYNWRRDIAHRPFIDIVDSVIGNTYFDFFKLKSNDSTSFFALCEGNVLSTWHFTRSQQQKLREYPFKSTGYFHVLEYQGKPYLISAEGTVFKLGRQMKKVQQLPRPLKEGWLIVDKDHDKIYFLEQKYFSFADKPRAIPDLLKNAFVVF